MAPNAWGITLNDGDSPPNFTIDHYDGTGTYTDSPMEMSGVDGSIQFNHPVFLSRDPVQPMEPVTLEYLSSHPTGIPDAPDNQTYGRALGAWNLVVPAAGGTFTGQTNLAAGGAVTGGALLFAGNAVCSIPTIAQLSIGGGSLGQVPATDGNGNLSWVTPVTGGPYLPIAGGTVTGSLTVNQVLTVQGANSMVLNAPNGQQRAILGQTSTLTRWQLMLGDGTSEGLNNTGSNFSLTAYATAGGFLGNWLTIARADGSAVFNGSGVTIQGGLAVNGLLALASPNNLAIYGGSAGQVLTTNGSGILSWTTPAGGGGGISDAPNDGTAYARKSAAWAHLAHTDITDWTATLAPYALITAIPVASTTTPLMDGTAAVGIGTTWARADHVHPTDTTRAAASALPVASTTLPLPSGTAAIGTSTAYARADHVHPLSPQAIGDNRIINGDMRINQRNAPISVGTAYVVDRWAASVGSGIGTAVGTSSAAMAPNGFATCLMFTSTSAHVSAAIDSFFFYQIIEADMVSDLAWGTANAQPVTLSFWVNATVAGTYSGAIFNLPTPPTRCYPFTFPVVAGWSKVVVNIPGDTAGTWVMSGNAGGVGVKFDIGSGATFRSSAGSWQSGNFNGVTGTVQVTATNAAIIQFTGVKLEIGNVATPFNRQSLAKSMADCQRYYQAGQIYMTASNQAAGGSIVSGQSVPTQMRAAGTMTVAANNNSNVGAPTLGNNNFVLWASGTVTAAGGASLNVTYTASAEL